MAAAEVSSNGDFFSRKANRTLRSSAATQLEIPLVSHVYQHQADKSRNNLPQYTRNCSDFNQFSKMIFKYLTF